MKHTVKQILAALMALALAFSLVGCGGASNTAKAEKTVKLTLDMLKSGDSEALMAIAADSEDLDEESMEMMTSLYNTMFGKMEYKILSSEEVADSTVHVTIEVTNVDMEPVMTQFLGKVIEYALANATKDISEEEMTVAVIGILESLVSDPTAETITAQTTLVVEKIGDDWVLDTPDTEVLDVLTGGLMTAVENMENGLS